MASQIQGVKKMRGLMMIVLFASALSLFGCAVTPAPHEPAAGAGKPVTTGQKAKPLIKCGTCGVEFTTQKELEEHIKTHPGHEAAPME
jgi:hypothetical protein